MLTVINWLVLDRWVSITKTLQNMEMCELQAVIVNSIEHHEADMCILETTKLIPRKGMSQLLEKL